MPIMEGEGLRVLIVDDNPTNRRIVEKLVLMKFGHAISDLTLADSAQATLELAAEKVFDLILLDINLGEGMDGVEVARKIRSMEDGMLEENQDCDIVAVTTDMGLPEIQRYREVGMNGVIGKPLYTKDLALAVDRTLTRLRVVSPFSDPGPSITSRAYIMHARASSFYICRKDSVSAPSSTVDASESRRHSSASDSEIVLWGSPITSRPSTGTLYSLAEDSYSSPTSSSRPSPAPVSHAFDWSSATSGSLISVAASDSSETIFEEPPPPPPPVLSPPLPIRTDSLSFGSFFPKRPPLAPRGDSSESFASSSSPPSIASDLDNSSFIRCSSDCTPTSSVWADEPDPFLSSLLADKISDQSSPIIRALTWSTGDRAKSTGQSMTRARTQTSIRYSRPQSLINVPIEQSVLSKGDMSLLEALTGPLKDLRLAESPTSTDVEVGKDV